MTGISALMSSYGTRVPVPNLVFDLDAANYSAVPTAVGSAQFSGSNWLSTSTGVTIGSGAYTVEGWAYFSTANLPGVMLSTLTASNNGFTLLIFSATQIRIDRNGFAADTYDVPAMASNTWHHIAATRDSSGNQTIFVDGVRSTTGAITNNSNFSGVSAGVGKFNQGGQWWFTGQISSLRAVVGSNVYDPTQTTITVPTTALSNITNTKLLLLFSTSGTLLADNSSINNTVTNNGSVAFNSASPFPAVNDATGNYAITTINPNSRISWSSDNGGVFRVTTSSSTNFMTFGPNYGSAQAFTVGMAYKWNGTTPNAGRLLNANSSSPDFLMGLWGSGAGVMNIAYGDAFVGSSSTAADTAWHFIWFTNTGSAGATKAKSYVATNTAPSTTFGTGSTNNGFNGLRLFGRFLNSTTSTEQVDADVGFVKVWDGALTLAQIQAEHAAYKTRFGY